MPSKRLKNLVKKRTIKLLQEIIYVRRRAKYIPYIVYKVASFIINPVSKFNEFESQLKSVKNRFQLSASLNLEKLNTILRGTNHI